MADDFWAAITHLNTLAVELDASGPAAAEKLDKVVGKFGHLIEANAKQIVPVDTGNLRSSIRTDLYRDGSGLGYTSIAEVGTDVSYAAFVELGTSRMAPYAFLGPSLDRYTPAFVAAVEAVGVSEALR